MEGAKIDYESLSIDLSERTATILLDRPGKLNAIDGRCLEDLIDLMQRLSVEGIRAAVLTGAGRAFSAGADIGSLGELDGVPAYRSRLRLFAEAFRAIEVAPFPVIAAVNGVAYGAGFELALASDIAIASTRATFAFKEAAVGLMPTFGLVRGPDIIGKRATAYLAMTGREIDARDAFHLGLVSEVVEPSELTEAARATAFDLASNAPLSVAAAKRFLNSQDWADGIAESIDMTTMLFSSNDHQEGVDAFREKRDPWFVGE